MISKKIWLLFCLPLLLSSCYLGRDVIWNTADIHDYKKFASVKIEKSSSPFHFIESVNWSNYKPFKNATDSLTRVFFDKNKTVAFLVIRNDSILYEYYSDGYFQNSIVPSFSVAKSFISLLTGIAIDEGFIKSVQEPITNYLPELDKEKFSGITIENLLDMRSGIRFKETYMNPFGDAARYYYGLNLKKFMPKLKIKKSADKEFDYISVNTQLLAWIIERVTGTAVEEYFRKKVWEPLGMEYDASWSVDSKRNKTVKAFCCLNARARDFAKLGRLYLNNGNWNGKQIVSSQWVKWTTTPEEKNRFEYSYGWWHNVDYSLEKDTVQVLNYWDYLRLSSDKSNTIINRPQTDYYAEGILGQFVYVNPGKKTVIVRLGKNYGHIPWQRIFLGIAEEKARLVHK